MPKNEQLLRISIVAKLLGVSRAMVYRYIKENRLGAIQLPSGGMRVRQSEFDRFISSLPSSTYIDELV